MPDLPVMKPSNETKPPPHAGPDRMPARKRMYQALVARDPAFEGIFFFGVRTTKIFCRPTCRAKIPRFQNVEFFSSPEAAREAGFRPCLRCRPGESNGQPPATMQRLMLELQNRPDGRLPDKELGDLGIQPTTARRQFKKYRGISFQAYQRARRLGLAWRDVRAGSTSKEAQTRRGFKSPSAFREAFAKTFGKTPGVVGATGSPLVQQHLSTPLGELLALADDAGLRVLQFPDHPALAGQVERCRRQLGTMNVPGSNGHLEAVGRELDQYFAGQRKIFTVALAPIGTSFQRRVWNQLSEVGFSGLCTYSELARGLGKPGGARALGNALGANPIVILIPCHRVVRGDGTIGGYGGGAWRKRRLLAHERRFGQHAAGTTRASDP
jgi:AraC family transcriptional regulator of adaptative response/methylated-DNA-[protein]-cysteine methyltransferase